MAVMIGDDCIACGVCEEVCPAEAILPNGRRTARVYEALMAASTLGRYRAFVVREAARLALGPDERVLDLCCGTGLLTRELARWLGPRGEVVGVDASEAMLEAATRASVSVSRASPPGAQVSFVAARAESLPFPDSSFDYATMFLGLHEIAEASRLPALAEVRRVLRPGGRGAIADFAAGGSILRRGLIRFGLGVLEGPDARTIAETGISALLREAGLAPGEPRPAFLGVIEVVPFARPGA